MVRFVARPQPFQNPNRFVFRGLVHCNRLESALQSCILLNMFPVFLNGRRADQLQLAARQRRLQNVAGIHGALCRTGADDGVNLIDKEQYVSGLHHFLQDLFDSLFELAAVLRSRNHPREIQGHKAFVRQGFRHFTAYNQLGKSLDNRCLADARLSDQAGVVLRSAAQNLHDTLHLNASSDHRIQFALARKFREVARILIQGRRRLCGAAHNTAALCLLRHVLR